LEEKDVPPSQGNGRKILGGFGGVYGVGREGSVPREEEELLQFNDQVLNVNYEALDPCLRA
jgi:hypothetical protein